MIASASSLNSMDDPSDEDFQAWADRYLDECTLPAVKVTAKGEDGKFHDFMHWLPTGELMAWPEYKGLFFDNLDKQFALVQEFKEYVIARPCPLPSELRSALYDQAFSHAEGKLSKLTEDPCKPAFWEHMYVYWTDHVATACLAFDLGVKTGQGKS